MHIDYVAKECLVILALLLPVASIEESLAAAPNSGGGGNGYGNNGGDKSMSSKLMAWYGNGVMDIFITPMGMIGVAVITLFITF